MLQLSRAGRSALTSRFICTSCRALLARGAPRLPGAVARLCAARHYYSTEQPKQEQKTGESDTKPKGKRGEKSEKKPRSKPNKSAASEQTQKDPSQSVKKRTARGRLRRAKANTPSPEPHLWRKTLSILMDIQADQKASLRSKANHDSEELQEADQKSGSEKAGSGKAKRRASSKKTDEKSLGDTKLLEDTLAALKEVLHQELEETAPRPDPASGKKRPVSPASKAKEEKGKRASTDSAADEKPAEKLVEKLAGKPAKAKPSPLSLPSKPLGALVPSSKKARRNFTIGRIDVSKIELAPVEKPQPPVPRLAYGLDRVLFNPGVYHLQDPRSRVFNFDPYLARIMPIEQFDYNALKRYITSSKDNTLIGTAAGHGKKYTGSTSSMTSTLSHFHYLLSAWRPINPAMMSRSFEVDSHSFTRIMRAPAATFLHWKDGTYAIDADKEFDTANVLSMLGKSMEKFFTLPKEEFEKYRRSNSDQLTEEERNGPESYHYTTLGDFMMRSQLDAYDPRLPGTGMFDLKTRAVISIRMDARDVMKGVGYEIRDRFGQWESYEREYYDMIRSAFLKYSLQVRMGRMDGIFVAYHNTRRVFGFQYIPLQEMDLSIHGQADTTLGDREFKLSVYLLNKVLDKVTAKYPGRSLRLHLETRGDDTPFMYIFAKPVTPVEIDQIQGATQAKIEEFERHMMGIAREKDRALEEDEDGEEGVDEFDDEDVDDTEGEDLTSLAVWEDVMDKVEDELEDEEHGVTFVREAIEDALQESGLLRMTAPDETQRYVDAFLEALTSNGQAAATRPESSDAVQGPTEKPSEAESPIEPSEGLSDTDRTPGNVPATTPDVKDTTEEAWDNAQPPATGDSPSEEPTLKDLIVKLAAQIRSIPSGKRSVGEQEIEDDVPTYTSKLRKIERLLSELTDLPQGEKETEEGEETGATERGSISIEPEEPTELAEHAKQGEEKVEHAAETGETPSTPLEGSTPAEPAAATSSSSAADESAVANGFVEEVHEDTELYGLILTVRNKVDGQYVERPDKLKRKQRWTVEYAFEEMKPDRARNLYKAVLNRRKKLLYPDDSGEGESDKWASMFQGRLKRYSMRGRSFRRREEKRMRERPVYIYGSDKPYTWDSVFDNGEENGVKPYTEWQPPSEEGEEEEGEASGHNDSETPEKREEQ
ncbi:mitochondrial protein Pet127-domain-containing protein [Chaetomium strumarium]|uniref:Mitochondrial protein Pet127-domain-containing protein n=1 Tax=Chaetomium strumarium TaxID=1170767 RepID=A0AAJ0H011_9PEZI|nr:mitochondrial protein Pet127-domain-containing protein [Chaetomium strumarium]